MTDQNQERSSGHDLDLLLDAALAKRAAVEPRAGLEDRVLANLRADRERVRPHAWWRWGLAAVCAILVVAVSFVFRAGKRSQPVIVQQTSAAAQGGGGPAGQIARHKETHAPSRPAIRTTRTHRAATVGATAVASTPKLDQFPSPQPLTEEEQMLMRLVAQNPEHAALLAEARMDSLRRDEEERQQREIEQGTTQ
ncbi:MAG: hypothetical protein ACRD3B_07345 [Candidatus Sulfotelmatobacter sp.]